jgi:N-acetylmuramic acid 6-phosphate etherase
MSTEDTSPRFIDLDAWPTDDAIEALYEGQLAAVAAVRPALKAIARATDAAANALSQGGRLVYVGAGTSGRIGVQDGVELTPTFNWPLDSTVFAMAGGPLAFTRSVEGAEDDIAAAVARMDEIGVGAHDVVIGLAASGSTPFTVAALRRAGERGAVTISIANNPGTPVLAVAQHGILIETGVEVIAGSTRMKAGTAQKVVLNILSSAIMVRLGRIYRGMMVNMTPNNAKLRRRAGLMVSTLAGVDEQAGIAALAAGNGDPKLAVLLARGLPLPQARALLEESGGSLRRAIETMDEVKP